MNSWAYLLLSVLDFIVFSYADGWLLHSVFSTFLIGLLTTQRYDTISWEHAWPIAMLLIEDCFLFDRFGLVAVFLLPMFVFIHIAKFAFARPILLYLLFPVTLGGFLVFNHIGASLLVLGTATTTPMTIRLFFGNLGVGILAFWCLWGNCSSILKRGKSGLHAGRMPY